MKRIYLYSFIFVVSYTKLLAQQMPYYTQNGNNSLLMNPAISGTKRTLDARLDWRAQWVGYDGAPRTETFSLNSRFYRGTMGASFYVLEDKIGPSRQTNFGVNYAYHIRFPDCELSAGVGGIFTKYTLYGDEITLHNTQDAAIDQTVSSAVWVADANAGIYLYNDRFHIGISCLHLAEQTAHFYVNDTTKHGKVKYQPHINLSVGYNFAQNPEYVWESTVQASYVPGTPFFLDYTLRLHIKEMIICGLSLRLHDAVALHLGAVFLENFQVTYSYDFLLSKLRNYSSGSHEIMLIYNLKEFHKKKHGHLDMQFIKQKYAYMF